jgi:tRNA(Ile)-lysidine synthase
MDQHGESRVDFPGQRVQRIGPAIVLTGRVDGARGRPSGEASNLFRFPLSIPGEVALRDAGWALTVERLASDAVGERTSAAVSNGTGKDVVLVRGDICRGSLAVRNRRPGDRFRPVGLVGQKKLQDYFVDRKVARKDRDTVPLVVDETDRIVWVAGFGIDEAFRVTDPAQAVLILKLRHA